MSSRTIVVLERVRADRQPAYCIHGKVTCIGCGYWCWLGSETYGPVAGHLVDPLCMDCAHRIYPKGIRPLGHITDHRRTDGPHALP